MNIAVLSGKGGTGKTTVSTNLALCLDANYIDCDVEEPNGFLFLNPQGIIEKDVNVERPVINQEKCNNCGNCSRTCRFNAIANLGEEILIFDKLCHSCKVCELVCETGALTFGEAKIGKIELGKKDSIICMRGILDIGEPMAVPIINQLLKGLPKGLNLLDCSPGTSCNTVNTLSFADGAILVTEPTAFGLHDLEIAVDLVKKVGLPLGVIINKAGKEYKELDKYLEENIIPIIGEIPFSKEGARLYSEGKMLIENERYSKAFYEIVKGLKEVLLWN